MEKSPRTESKKTELALTSWETKMDEKKIDELDSSFVLKAMKDEDMDALVAMQPFTVAVLLNYWNKIQIPIEFREVPPCVVILSSGDIVAINAPNKENAPWIKEFVGGGGYPQHEGERMVEVLARALKRKGLKNGNIGFEKGFVPVGTMDWIKSELPDIVPVDGEWILWQLRAVKTKQQLGFIKNAINACEAGVKEMLGNWEEGKTIRELQNKFEGVVREHGAEFFGDYHTAVARQWVPFHRKSNYSLNSPYNEGVSSNLPEDFVIKRDDGIDVSFDLIVRYQGYFSDWGRAVYLGTPPKKIVDNYNLRWTVQKTIAEEVKPGMTTIEAQEACDNRLKKEGIVHWWCIHSVGLEIHEEPLIGTAPVISDSGQVNKTIGFPGLMWGRNQKITFEPNTIVMVEAGGGVEDPYLMTKKGLKRLTTLSQELFIV